MNPTAEEYLRLPYTRRVRPDKGTRGESLFLAWVDELPGCESHGQTASEALESLDGAIEMYICSLLEDGLDPPIPSGSTRPEPHAPAVH
jgi:predicted RNase H-like HicB family nuclease